MGTMPMYEYRCGECGARFEALVAAGTETETCRECGAEGAAREMSLPAQPPRLVKSAAGNRRQETRNRALKESTKRSFEQKRERARAAAKARGGAK